MQGLEPARAHPGPWPPWLRWALPNPRGSGGPPEVGHKAPHLHPGVVQKAGCLESLPVAGGSHAHWPSPERSLGPLPAQQSPLRALAWGWRLGWPHPGAEQSQEGRMAAKGPVHRQGCPWGLFGSDAVDWLGSRIFPLRTAGLYRALCLEEIGKCLCTSLLWCCSPGTSLARKMPSMTCRPHMLVFSSPVCLTSPLRPPHQQCPPATPHPFPLVVQEHSALRHNLPPPAGGVARKHASGMLPTSQSTNS